MSKRRKERRSSVRKRARREQQVPRARRDWSLVFGEATLIAMVAAVPLALNRNSRNIMDIKDVILGLGVALGISAWLLAGLHRGRLTWARSPVTTGVLAFTLWAGISVLYSRYWFVSISEFGRLAAHVGLFWLALASLRRMVQVRRVVAAACAAAVPIVIYAFMQAAGADPIDWATTSTGRVFSFLANPTYLGSYLALLIPVAIAVGWPLPDSGRATAAARWVISGLFLLIAALMAVALYLSFTLGAVAGLAIGSLLALVLAIIRRGIPAVRRAAPALIAASAGLALVLVVAYRLMPATQQKRVQQVIHFQDPYGKERQLHWRVAIDLFRQRPLTGSGYGTFRIYSLEKLSPEWYLEAPGRRKGMLVPGYAHNEYLQMLTDNGIVGGAALAALLVLFYWVAVRVLLREQDRAWWRLGLGITVGMTAFVVQNFFAVTFRQTGAVTFFWLWLGVMAVAGARLPAAGEGVQEPRLREIELPRASWGGLAAAAAILAAGLAVLSWVTIRPMLASLYVREAQGAAVRGYYRESADLSERAIELCPYSAIAYYTAAYAWGQLGDLEKSASASQQALRLLPGNASFYYNLGVSYKKMGKLDEAITSFRKAVELMPTSAQHHAALAEALEAKGEYEEAEREIRRAIELDGSDANMHILLSEIALRRNDVAQGLAALRAAAKAAPNKVDVRRAIAVMLFTQKRYEEARAAYEDWIRLEPGSAEAYNGLGACQLRLRQYPQAKGSFERALGLQPRYQPARLNLANTYLAMGDVAAGRRELERVRDLDPNSREGQAAQEILAKLSAPRPPAPARRPAGQP
jgi:tetratricopeptide (TPR) repeat protein/O-antigen ligase